MLETRDILKILPHRYPFLLIDKILELDVGKRAVGIKNVTMNEPFFAGHFPDFPVMPGVLIVEAMAQVGGIVLLKLPQAEGKIAFFTGIDQVRFRKTVVPGDQLRIEVEVTKIKGMMCKMKAIATVEGIVVAEGELMCSLGDRDLSGVKIHPTAIVHPSAELGNNVEIGPYSVIGPEVTVGDRTRIESYATISKWTQIGADNHLHYGTVIGNAPQDLRYKGEKNSIVIGDRNLIREFVTINLPTGEGAKTRIGNDNFIMIQTHVAHNCEIGNQVVISNLVGFCGHVTVEDQVVIGGMAGFHQYVRIGRLAMIGGQAKVIQDVPPFMLVDGNPAQIRGINTVGMSRRDISNDTISEIKKAFKILYKSNLNISQAVAKIKKETKPLDEINYLVKFLEESTERGIARKAEEISEEELKERIFAEIPELGI